MQNSLVLAVALFLTGCATTDPTISTVVQKVDIPISIPCKAQAPIKPEFNFGKLSEEQTIDEKARVLLADRLLHLGYELELETALGSCIK